MFAPNNMQTHVAACVAGHNMNSQAVYYIVSIVLYVLYCTVLYCIGILNSFTINKPGSTKPTKGNSNKKKIQVFKHSPHATS
jgi:hypothetical protein